MNLNEALKEFESWGMQNAFVDFTKTTDEESLKTSITLHLVSEEAHRFIAELKSRNLYEKYYEMRQSKNKLK